MPAQWLDGGLLLLFSTEYPSQVPKLPWVEGLFHGRVACLLKLTVKHLIGFSSIAFL